MRATPTGTGVVSLPDHHNVCELGSELVSISKERWGSGWLLWGAYPCCGLVLCESLEVEPEMVLVGGRRFDVGSRTAADGTT